MLLLSSLCCAPQLCPTLPVPHSGGAPGLIRICSLERAGHGKPASAWVNLPLWGDDSSHRPQAAQSRGHVSHTAGHRGQTLVLSKGQFLTSRASTSSELFTEAPEANKAGSPATRRASRQTLLPALMYRHFSFLRTAA